LIPENSIVLIIILLNVIISFIGFSNPYFFSKYKFTISGIDQGQYYRYFSSAFLHVGTSHLLFNMLTFYFFAPIVSNVFDNLQFILIYAGGLFAGGWMSYRLNQQKKGYSAVGASGAVIGILFASIIIRPDLDLYIFFIPIPIKGYLFAIIYIIYTITSMNNQRDSIGHSAHLGGAIGGLAVTLLLKPELLKDSVEIILLMLGAIAVGALIIKRISNKLQS